MLSEEFDKKIREAADHHHPAYDERAWKDMHRLLNKHMPQDERRRRWIFFLLLFLLLSGGIAGWINGWWTTGSKGKPSMTVTGNKPGIPAPSSGTDPQQPVPVNSGEKQNPANPGNQPVESSTTIASPAVVTPAATAGGLKKNTSGSIQDNGLPVTFATGTARVKKQKQPTGIKGDHPDDGTNQTAEAAALPKGQLQSARPAAATAPAQPVNSVSEQALKQESAATHPLRETTDPPAAASLQTAAEKKPEEKKEKAVAAAGKKKSSRNNRFFLAVSAGPDVSFTNGDAPGRMKIVGGLGLGYTFNDRLSLRTGFYSGRKIYTASADQYHGSPAFYQYYPNLQKVEADCKVYEIPVALSYHFGTAGKRRFFASAGVSSLIMKEETYTYFYKYNTSGPTVSRTHSTYNKNKHFLSIATVSAGYQQALGSRFQLIAEPYIKLPLSGVGNGKVNLNSTGIQFTLGFAPFGKKKGAAGSH